VRPTVREPPVKGVSLAHRSLKLSEKFVRDGGAKQKWGGADVNKMLDFIVKLNITSRLCSTSASVRGPCFAELEQAFLEAGCVRDR